MRASDRAHWLRQATELLHDRLGPSECEMLHAGLVELSQRDITIMHLSCNYVLSWSALSILKEEEMARDWSDTYGHWIRAQMPG
jgi:hypothetical protein